MELWTITLIAALVVLTVNYCSLEAMLYEQNDEIVMAHGNRKQKTAEENAKWL